MLSLGMYGISPGGPTMSVSVTSPGALSLYSGNLPRSLNSTPRLNWRAGDTALNMKHMSTALFMAHELLSVG